MSLEFDGMTGGFSRYGSYLSNELNTERANKFNFKLKLASLVGYPLVIVSYPEVMPVYPEDDLLVLDGIIGSYIACREFHGRIQQVVNESSKVIEKLDETEVHEYVQDLVWGTEIETELEHNPIARGAAEYEQACRENGIKYYSLSYFAEPSLPEIKDMFDVKGLQARVEAMEYLVGIGCCIKIKTPTNPIEEKVVVRNFGGMGILPLTIAENIAKYRGFKRAYLLYAQNQ